MQQKAADVRRMKRHDHVSINLRVQIGDEWRRIRANDWNEVGFNFYLDIDLTANRASFAKGASVFQGDLVWRYMNEDDHIVREMILNRLLIKHIRKAVHDRESLRRMLCLVRAKGLADEKRRLLSCLGVNITEEEEAVMVQQSRAEYPLYRYGVKVDAKEWADVVRLTLETTSVLDIMEQINSDLGRIDRS